MRRVLVAVGFSAALLAGAAPAAAFCRITTIETVVDGADTTACYDTTHPPVWWRTACVGLSVQAGGSKYAPASVVTDLLFRTVLPNWQNADCPGGGHPSLAFFDLGPERCGARQANLYAPNANAVLFHDDEWPYDDGAGCSPDDVTVALTTVTFHPETGELWDADIEINTACHPISTTLPVPPDRYDLQSILQHETGHFLGLAHPPDPSAVMYYLYSQGNDGKRVLSPDDVRGACTIYPPSGERSVGARVADGGVIAEGTCDPTPRNGFGGACVSEAGDQPPAEPSTALSCRASPSRSAPSHPFQYAFTIALSLTAFARRRLRVRPGSACYGARG